MTPDRPIFPEPDNSPGRTGIKIEIPDLHALHTFAAERAAGDGDITLNESGQRLEKYFFHTEGEKSGNVRWEAKMDGVLTAKCVLVLDFGYRIETGEYVEFTSTLWTPTSEISFEIARRSKQIRDILVLGGLNVVLEIDHTGGRLLKISRDGQEGHLVFNLDYVDFADAEKQFGPDEAERHGNSPFILSPDDTINLYGIDEFTRALVAYQELAPTIITALYKAFDMETPAVELALTLPKK